MNFLLGELCGNVGHNEGFKLNRKMTTFENLEKLRIFVKSRVKVAIGSLRFIQGCLLISSHEIRFSLGTKMREIKSLTSADKFLASGTG